MNNSTGAIRITQLDNGLRVLTNTSVNTKISTVAVLVGVGSEHELPHENGLSHFLEHMAFKGTTTRSAIEISRAGEVFGAEMNAFTSRDAICYHVTSLGEHTNKWVELLSDIIQNSVYDPSEIEVEQGVVVQEIHSYQDRLPSQAYDAMFASAYADQSYGRAILGTVETVRSFDQAAIKAYVAKHYFAENMLVVGAGAVDHDAFVEEVKSHFGNLARGTVERGAGPVFVSETEVTEIKLPKFDQVATMLSFEAPKWGATKEAAIADVFADALGGGMSSPLFQELREKRGLCYATRASYLVQGSATMLNVMMMTTAEHADVFEEVALAEIRKFADGDFADDELIRAINTLRFNISRVQEKTYRAAEAIGISLLTCGEAFDIEAFDALLESVTREDLSAFAKSILESPRLLVKVGNF